MLRQLNGQVVLLLERAAQARERAAATCDPETRRIHQRMETSWTNLAASVAFVERADLFLHTVRHRVPPRDLCFACRRAMPLKSVVAVRGEETHTFECVSCQREQVRRFAPGPVGISSRSILTMLDA